MSAIAGGLGIGAGVGVSSVALAPFNAANTFLGSAFFGYGMILGERYMYQEDWPKIQQRLVNGEKIENIIQEYTGVFTATVMKEAKIIFDTVTQEFIKIMQEAISSTNASTLTVTTGKEEEQQARRGRTTTPQSTPSTGGITGGVQTGTSIKQTSAQAFALARQGPINKQIDTIIKSAPKVKPSAGPSQIVLRNRIIKEIERLRLYIKANEAWFKINRGAKNFNTVKVNNLQGIKLMEQNQVALASLLSNYIWT